MPLLHQGPAFFQAGVRLAGASLCPLLSSGNSPVLPLSGLLSIQAPPKLPWVALQLLHVQNLNPVVLSTGKAIKDFSVSTLGLSYRLVVDGRIHVGCCGAYKARLGWAPLTL